MDCNFCESMFLQAEAIQRGWDIGGPFASNPKSAYQAAVTESFKWLGVPNAATEASDIWPTMPTMIIRQHKLKK
jgi:hypothetical protein